MAIREIKEITCDVCSAIIKTSSDEHCPITIQVIFTTEQNEGRVCAPYLSSQKIDICPDCMKIMLSGKMLFAHGAMGYNKYYFKQE